MGLKSYLSIDHGIADIIWPRLALSGLDCWHLTSGLCIQMSFFRSQNATFQTVRQLQQVLWIMIACWLPFHTASTTTTTAHGLTLPVANNPFL